MRSEIRASLYNAKESKGDLSVSNHLLFKTVPKGKELGYLTKRVVQERKERKKERKKEEQHEDFPVPGRRIL